ncbi:dihydrofolate reductase [Deinococcus soli (ex Cha et al. 2016)]|uniref:Dihydrofolate reductase n=2 Tax=Deinococcus soli (ex Cha et al. 2016) TaxID=1309411 RepID=A0ACC6KHL2_9DEIO|nr:dihydrofolate reductase [Deinococcus soli (ex Cha et al. 2016)]MDR6218767.1 dihydrofolate reductase [Deinococcus soli (ex Cha et al. 2016)]MDR6328564.1 dihydrofolate reductase [Deinococcus soli (ex Cha et al. 2016)]MDR6751949.1 dihydrofolate reductase [Deinococcus soli (ex Cha et al. 2016)]
MTHPAHLSMIAAMSENRVIGRDNQLPWHLPADLAHFKRLTAGKPVIMGRNVHDSIGRPLPDRLNIILSRNPDLHAPGCVVTHTPAAALAAAGDAPEVMIIGGQQIYEVFLPQVTALHLTVVHARVDGDTVFPALDSGWEIVQTRTRPADDRNRFAMSFLTYQRAP